jgi:phosphate:Na+ symporter
MNPSALFALLGGLAVFMLGLSIMTDGLKAAAGDHLRHALSLTTRSKAVALGTGTFLGFMMHSTAASVMTVGFVHAGLLTLGKAAPLFFGANVGTTLSMQLVAFRLADYALLAVAVGFLLQMVFERPALKQGGRALLGFGLLFLGINLMGEAVHPYRAEVQPWLAMLNGNSITGLLTGIGLATLATVALQSSGAVIGITFAMVGSGIITGLEQVLPIVLGAHIGTSSTAIIASLPRNIEAKRAAFLNLGFNLFNVSLAVIAAPIFLWAVRLLGGDLVRQTANLHTLVMAVAAVLLLPLTSPYAKLVRRLVPSRQPPPQPSYLDRDLLVRPERAIAAAVAELQRAASLCRDSFAQAREIATGEFSRKMVGELRRREESVNEIKGAVKSYLASLAGRYLSRRQALFVQALDRCMADLERVGDHISSISRVSERRHRSDREAINPEVTRLLRHLFEAASGMVDQTVETLNPESEDFAAGGRRLLERRESFARESSIAKSAVNERIWTHELHPLVGLYFSEYAAALDRIGRHCRSIAMEQQQAVFRIERRKLDKEVAPAPVKPAGVAK